MGTGVAGSDGSADNGTETPGLKTKRGPIGEWAERFVPSSHEQMLMEAEHLGRYLWAGQAVRGQDALDAGCGMGYGLALLNRLGASSVTGVDVEEEALEEARRSFGDFASCHRADLAVLPFDDDSFDLITCFEVIEHVADQKRALEELRRVLRPDGVLFISSPNRGIYPGGNPWHLHEFTPDELRSELTERFANVRMFGQEPHFSSLIADLDALGSGDGGDRIDAEVRKLEGTIPGAEQYTIGVASDAELPELANTTMIGGGLDVKMTYDALLAWEARARRAEAELELEMMDHQRVEMILQQVRQRLIELEPGPVRTALGRLRRKLRAGLARRRAR
jgi:SAM-dependent methyltransferase